MPGSQPALGQLCYEQNKFALLRRKPAAGRDRNLQRQLGLDRRRNEGEASSSSRRRGAGEIEEHREIAWERMAAE